MTNKTLVTVAEATSKRLAASVRLRADMEQRANDLVLYAKRSRRDRLEGYVEFTAKRRTLILLALQGIHNLCDVGRSVEFQALLRARKRPLVLVGGTESFSAGYDMADVHWRWTAYIELDHEAVRVRCYTESSGDWGRTYKRDQNVDQIDFLYSVENSFLRTLALNKIATNYRIDLEWVEKSKDVNVRLSSDNLFETLIRCADDEYVAGLFRTALCISEQP